MKPQSVSPGATPLLAATLAAMALAAWAGSAAPASRVSPPARSAAATARARGAEPAAATIRNAGPAATLAGAGMVVGLDPETGRSGVLTSEQLSRLTARLRDRAAQAGVRPAPIYRANGRVSMDVRSWMREYSVVRAGANGQAVVGCVDGREAAKRITDGAPMPGREER